MRRALVVALLALLLLPGAASALTVNDVAQQVRCPTCNTPLDVSNSPLATRMRAYIGDRIDRGWSEERSRGSDPLPERPPSSISMSARKSWLISSASSGYFC